MNLLGGMPRVSCALDARLSRKEQDSMVCSMSAEEGEPPREDSGRHGQKGASVRLKGPLPAQKQLDSCFLVPHCMPNHCLERLYMFTVSETTATLFSDSKEWTFEPERRDRVRGSGSRVLVCTGSEAMYKRLEVILLPKRTNLCRSLPDLQRQGRRPSHFVIPPLSSPGL